VPPPKVYMNMGSGTSDADGRSVPLITPYVAVVLMAFAVFAVVAYLLVTM
jgi:hypothetical protein